MGATQSVTDPTKKEKVEKLFRANNRSNRSRSLDTRQEQRPSRPVGSSHSAKFPKNRCISQYHKKSTDNSNQTSSNGGSISGLTREEKRIIQVCWFKCNQKQLRKCAEDIFADILHMDDDLLRLFRLDHIQSNRLRDAEFFKSHASNFAIVLSLVVTNLQEHVEQACEALQNLGRQHAAFLDKFFQSMYWDTFTDCFERNPPPAFRKGSEREAWSRMILFIIAQMKIGFQKAVSEQRTEQRLSVPQIY
ncbi:hypothetical protein WR25_06989 [Diploscapter pachys]|uniref:Globin domain-containing protein n=1 Tax=Diploscapter pachys TaxID=2018661 RepID=A0A2A2KP63_9BILA|nr:hypothetical protein WR25_06989 [Diploscapter pachys]